MAPCFSMYSCISCVPYALSASMLLPSMFKRDNISMACVLSWICPAVRLIYIEFPSPSTAAWILVVLPPELMPIADSLLNFLPLFWACTALMSPDYCWVDTKFFIVGIFFQMFKHLLKSSFITPFAKTWIHSFPWTETFRKVSPGRTTARNPQDSIKRRESFPGRPVLALGNICFILFHWSSETSYLLCMASPPMSFLLL